jgi:hypothetical protein
MYIIYKRWTNLNNMFILNIKHPINLYIHDIGMLLIVNVYLLLFKNNSICYQVIILVTIN